jgi:hypothetical protein
VQVRGRLVGEAPEEDNVDLPGKRIQSMSFWGPWRLGNLLVGYFPPGKLLGEFFDLVLSRNRDAFLKPSRTF